MKKIIFALILMLLVFSVVIHGEKVGVLPELMKPTFMGVDDTQLYVIEGASIYIYSLKELKVVKKFGREGQGPQEFQIFPPLQITLDASGDNITVFSFLKVSYFTKKGEFIKEIRAPSFSMNLQVFGDGFIGWTTAQQEGVRYKIVNIYDSKLNKLKEIYRIKDEFQKPGQGLKLLTKTTSFAGYENKIFLPGKDDATIAVFDGNMKKLFSINLDQKKVKVDQKIKDAVIEYLKTTPGIKEQFEAIKPIIFPEYFPTIAGFFVADNTIYVMTWKTENNSREFFTYDLKGKFKKRMMIDIKYETPVKPYPINIHKGKLYQIVENEEEEEWELHMSVVK